MSTDYLFPQVGDHVIAGDRGWTGTVLFRGLPLAQWVIVKGNGTVKVTGVTDRGHAWRTHGQKFFVHHDYCLIRSTTYPSGKPLAEPRVRVIHRGWCRPLEDT